jgi:hypothetical protein
MFRFTGTALAASPALAILATSAALSLITPLIALADAIALVAGKPVDLRCETQATQLAPTAQVSAGAFRVRLEAMPGAADGATGNWKPIDRDDRHTGSLVERHREACKTGCPLYAGTGGKTFELWVPRRTTIDKAAPGEMLTIAVVDHAALTLKASTFQDQQIASLEQGACKIVE